jgi:hypothetical protein
MSCCTAHECAGALLKQLPAVQQATICKTNTIRLSNPVAGIHPLQAFQPEPNNCGANTRMRGVTELAQQLMADACQGSDPPLVLALPHTRQLSLYSSQGGEAHQRSQFVHHQ